MTPELWQRVQEILERALVMNPKDRPSFLEETCGGDPELRREVESLLATEDDATGFIEEPLLSLRPESRGPVARRSASTGSDETSELTSSGFVRVGDRVGPYRVLRELGRGGMGKVFLARRDDDEFERMVAIKLLKRDMDSDEIVRRFRHERQILANLVHPNIAELFDGGTTAGGLPYFVMEYVEGIRIDEYCDDHKLSIRDRLKLFRKVCSAVHFAHQSLVIHRDLKPGNILVTADGEPKLLDFGIAKLLPTEVSATEITADQLTAPGIDPMTPDYASPEQIKGDAITTASDVYSLGVLLYQLLTGRRPYRLTNRSVARLFKAITDQEPLRPSAAIPARGAGDDSPTAEEISADRGTEPRPLRRRLAGDLDAIVLKALRKEHPKRYSSAEQLSDDISRHLGGLPVVARQGTFLYQSTKFLRRNLLALAAAAAVFLMIVFGVRSMILASQADRDKQVAQSLSALFQSLQNLDPREADDPVFATQLHEQVRQNIDDLELATILSDQAGLLETQGGFATAEVLYREALEMAIRVVGKRHEKVAVIMNNLAASLEAQGDYAEAEELFREALDIRIEEHGRDSDRTARTLNNLGALLQNKGDLVAAEPYLRESLEIRQTLYEADAPEVALAINNLAFFFQASGDYEAAEAGYRQALRIYRTRFGLEHPNVGVVTKNLASLLTQTGDLENAEKRAREALDILGNTFIKHWRIADAESVVGGAVAARGRYDEAEPLLRDSYTILSTTKGPSARQTKEALERLEALEEARLKEGHQP